MNRALTFIWLFLITLTTASWLLAERHVLPNRRIADIVVDGSAAVDVSLDIIMQALCARLGLCEGCNE